MQTTTLLDFEYRDATNSMHVRATQYDGVNGTTFRVSCSNTFLHVEHTVVSAQSKGDAYRVAYALQREYTLTLHTYLDSPM